VETVILTEGCVQFGKDWVWNAVMSIPIAAVCHATVQPSPYLATNNHDY